MSKFKKVVVRSMLTLLIAIPICLALLYYYIAHYYPARNKAWCESVIAELKDNPAAFRQTYAEAANEGGYFFCINGNECRSASFFLRNNGAYQCQHRGTIRMPDFGYIQSEDWTENPE